jgi:hypothetical protein
LDPKQKWRRGPVPNGELLGCCGNNYNMILVINTMFEYQKQQEEMPKGIKRGFTHMQRNLPMSFKAAKLPTHKRFMGVKAKKITLHFFSYWMNPFIIKP